MRKIYLLHAVAIVLIGSLMGTSCKKPLHANNPTNNNSRLSAYTRITTVSPVSRVATTVNENYRFYYDAANRVSQILFTNNEPLALQHRIIFSYSNDTVIKTTTDIVTNDLLEKDTLVYNSLGQLTTYFSPNSTTTFQYYGKLLATYTITARDNKGLTISAVTTYTSVNGDLLQHGFDGNLTAKMSTNRKAPFNTTWTYYLTTIFGSGYNGNTVNHPTAGSTDVLSGYTEGPIRFTSKDANSQTDTLTFPGELWTKESYHFYTEMANRIGDYMTIQSFTKYGYNVYQNEHLVESISSANRHANIKYSIDAYSNITQARVVTVDSVLTSYSDVYDYQYEVY